MGIVTGLAWTEMGGELLTTEATVMPGKGKLIITGKLGEVMQESAQAAMSYVRSPRRALRHRPASFAETSTSTSTCPRARSPRTGPRRASRWRPRWCRALTQHPGAPDVAMTGEITLRGRVLPIGGLKEKTLAAHRAGIKTVLIPKENRKDLRDIPMKIRDAAEHHPGGVRGRRAPRGAAAGEAGGVLPQAVPADEASKAALSVRRCRSRSRPCPASRSPQAPVGGCSDASRCLDAGMRGAPGGRRSPDFPLRAVRRYIPRASGSARAIAVPPAGAAAPAGPAASSPTPGVKIVVPAMPTTLDWSYSDPHELGELPGHARHPAGAHHAGGGQLGPARAGRALGARARRPGAMRSTLSICAET